MAESSFDVVSDYDRQELVNAVDQTLREIRTRYDLKNSKSSLELRPSSITLQAESEHIVKSIVDVLESKMVRRGLSLKVLQIGRMEPAAGGTQRLHIGLQRGINPDLAREMSKEIRSNNPKLKVSIQGDSLRISGKSKDALQEVISFLRSKDYAIPLQFVNYR